MNANQAKQVVLADLMQRLGFHALKTERGGQELKYLSPFRTEKEPSFNVNLVKNSWYDFGEAEGGNTLDFAIRYLRVQGKSFRTSDALAWLEGTMGRPAFSSSAVGQFKEQHSFLHLSPQKPEAVKAGSFPSPADRDLEFVKESPLQSPLVFSYLEGRGIPRGLAEKYLRLIHYQNKKKPSKRPYFAFGMKNRSGGYEIRSASDEPTLKFKSALIARDITVVPGRRGGGAVNIFEGQLDFLSLLAMFRTDQLSGDCIIMNGLQSYTLAKSYIREKSYMAINTFLDNNIPGQDRTQDFISDFGEIVTNHSPSFLPHVDLNDALRAGCIPMFSNQSPPSP